MSPRVTIPFMRGEAGEGNAGAAGSPAVAAAGEEKKFCGDKRREDIVSPRVTIPTFVEEIKGAEINSCVEAAMFLRVMAASEPGSPGESVDSQKATSAVVVPCPLQRIGCDESLPRCPCGRQKGVAR